jgi:NOL1/NOP2/sun family putative RNA methylase
MGIKLPEEFAKRLKEQIGDEKFEKYLECLKEKSYSAVRVNNLKLSDEEFEKLSPFEIKRVPWIHNGYYYDGSSGPSKDPFYFAGLYYIQDPSAMTPANLLPVKPGDRVLDLCAAPGGKTTELGAKLQGKGVLIANDISKSRAKALLKNIELFGISNACVVTESPDKLVPYFSGYFDKILVDAPCSGEGMFRKQPAIMDNWAHYGTEYYSKLQLQILDSAVKMLAPGGYLLYSTCTFSPLEDEGSVMHVLENNPDIHLVDPICESKKQSYEGFSKGNPDWWENGSPELSKCVRLWPFDIKGEGHFAALFKKDGETVHSVLNEAADNTNLEVKLNGEALKKSFKTREDEKISSFEEKWNKKDKQKGKKFTANKSKREIGSSAMDAPEIYDFKGTGFFDFSRIKEKNGYLNLLPEGLPDLNGLCVAREGLFLGVSKNGRFEPSQALACAMKKENFSNVVDLAHDDERVIHYLKCETIEADCSDGYVLICCAGFPLGFGKAKNGIIKNKYLPGWRLM